MYVKLKHCKKKHYKKKHKYDFLCGERIMATKVSDINLCFLSFRTWDTAVSGSLLSSSISVDVASGTETSPSRQVAKFQ